MSSSVSWVPLLFACWLCIVMTTFEFDPVPLTFRFAHNLSQDEFLSKFTKKGPSSERCLLDDVTANINLTEQVHLLSLRDGNVTHLSIRPPNLLDLIDPTLLKFIKKPEDFFKELTYNDLDQAYKNIEVNLTIEFRTYDEVVQNYLESIQRACLINATFYGSFWFDGHTDAASPSESDADYFWHLVEEPVEYLCDKRVNDTMFDSWLPGDNTSSEYNHLYEANSRVQSLDLKYENSSDMVIVRLSVIVYDWSFRFPSVFTSTIENYDLQTIGLDFHFAINSTVLPESGADTHWTMQFVFIGTVGGGLFVLLLVMSLVFITRSTRALDLGIWRVYANMRLEKAKQLSKN